METLKTRTGRKPDLTLLQLEELLELDLPEREPLLGPWLLQRHLNMTYAPTGVGKSMFAMSIALAVAGGGEYLGWKAPGPRPVLIVDGEMDVLDLRDRAQMLLPTIADVDPTSASQNLTILAHQAQEPGVSFPDLATSEGREAVLKIAMGHQAELVILDNFSTLVTVDDENAASSFNPVIDLMRSLKQQGSACMLIHHSRKGKGGQGTYRGTSKMGVVFNSIIELNHPDGLPSNSGTAFELVWEKYRGRRDETVCPLRVHLEDDPLSGSKWSHEVSEDGNIAALVSRLRSLEYSTQKELGDSLDLAAYQVTRIKQKAIRQGVITEEEWQECLRESNGIDPELDF